MKSYTASTLVNRARQTPIYPLVCQNYEIGWRIWKLCAESDGLWSIVNCYIFVEFDISKYKLLVTCSNEVVRERRAQSISNKVVRERTGQDTLESIIKERRLRWFGHAYRMDSNRLARQTLFWIPPDFKKKTGRLRVSWTSTIKKDLDLLGLTWDEALD